MLFSKKNTDILISLLISFLTFTVNAQQHNINKFNPVWGFQLAEESQTLDDIRKSKLWRNVKIPHDWSVEFSFDSINGEGCTGYLPGGIGWYRNEFIVKPGDDKNVYIYFDGVYNHSSYWLNGHKVGNQVYGYSPFYFDVSSYLIDGKNELIVKVDRSRIADSRWYPGSGIYREAKLITKQKLQIPIWGVFVTTPQVNDNKALVNVSVDVSNKHDQLQEFKLIATILNNKGEVIATNTSEKSLLKNEDANYDLQLEIPNPDLWHINNPVLYSVNVIIEQNGTKIALNTDNFGIRTFRFDAEKGFFLNGKNLKIKGICLHHDGGLVGAAVPKDVWRRRLNTLRNAGCNAIRSAHNPASEEFLDLCDEMGFLVQDEFFDEWDYPKDKRLNCWERNDDYESRGYADYFQENAETDLKNSMLAHRNHPCIFQWSIGNEVEWTYNRDRIATGYFDHTNNFNDNFFWDMPPYSPYKIKEVYNKLPKQEFAIEKTAFKLAEWTRELDTTRPVTANCILPSVSLENGFTDALDLVGFSYRRILYDYAREKYPDVIVLGTENLPQWHEWKAIEERPFISGTFLWTGIDYMGESNEQWPRKTLPSGIIDQAGFKKTAYHMYKTLWNDEPHVYICSQDTAQSRYKIASTGAVLEKEEGSWEKLRWIWHDLNEHWNYSPKEKVIVEVYSNCEQVELFQNDKSLGIKKLSDFPDRVYRWAVTFEEGELRAEGISNTKKVSQVLQTATTPTQVKVSIDKPTLHANNSDVAHIEFQLLDEAGNAVKHLEEKIYIDIDENLKNLGVDNGSPSNVQKFQYNEIITHNGRALCIVQAQNIHGKATIKVWGDNIPLKEYTINLIQDKSLKQ